MHPAPPPGIDLQAAGIGPFGTTPRCALTTDEALELYQDYDICGSRLPYRDAKLASNVAGAELFELWVYDRAIAAAESLHRILTRAGAVFACNAVQIPDGKCPISSGFDENCGAC